jgi:hypothetical protein
MLFFYGVIDSMSGLVEKLALEEGRSYDAIMDNIRIKFGLWEGTNYDAIIDSTTTLVGKLALMTMTEVVMAIFNMTFL